MGKLSQKDFKDGNHPVHLVNSAEGNLSTSALIPFCAFAGDMSVVGQSVDGFSLPVCNIFHPREVQTYIFIARKQEFSHLPRWRGNFVFLQILVRLRACLRLIREAIKVPTISRSSVTPFLLSSQV